MAGLQERLDQMEIAIHAPAFRDGSGRANEVNYWVFDYNPANELEVRERIECMKKKNAKGMDGFRLAVFDLYDMIMDYLEEKDFVKFYERYETRRGFEYIVRAVSTSIYHLDPANLVFYLRNDDESEEEEQITSTRHEVRKKFWTSALDLIKEANVESGAFSNCNPVKDNWINGYFGIQGFHLCCVANYDSARVEVHFGKADNDENKKAYDLVATHRAEIEKALGEELIWDRGDDRKSSKIYFEIDGVGITNEADWPVIAKFHAKWSARLYKAIVVPYLKPVYSDTLVPVKSANMPTSKNTIEIKKIVITDLDTDAIVNAVNDGLWAGGGVCGAIFRAAGHEKLKAACNKIGHCDTGSAVIAPGFDLKAKYIIHAVGPV